MNSNAHHVGLTVRDLDLALGFYRDALNLPVVSRLEVGGEELVIAVSVDGVSACFVHLNGDDVRVEFIEYDPVGTDTDESALNRPGATHPGLSVKDVDAAATQLPVDAETLSEPQTTKTGTRIVSVRDSEGSLVELLNA